MITFTEQSQRTHELLPWNEEAARWADEQRRRWNERSGLPNDIPCTLDQQVGRFQHLFCRCLLAWELGTIPKAVHQNATTPEDLVHWHSQGLAHHLRMRTRIWETWGCLPFDENKGKIHQSPDQADILWLAFDHEDAPGPLFNGFQPINIKVAGYITSDEFTQRKQRCWVGAWVDAVEQRDDNGLPIFTSLSQYKEQHGTR